MARFFSKISAIFGMIFLFNFSILLADSSIKGDVEYGEYLSSECVTCHQKSGDSGSIPSIAGLDPKNFVKILKLYKNKERSNKVMQTVAGRLTDEQIASLAIYFAGL